MSRQELMERRVGISEVSEYAANAKRALESVLIEEKGPIGDLVEGSLSGDNIAEGGPGGSGKTLSMNTLFQLIGLESDQIAVVPGVSDLSPSRLLGGENRKLIVDPSGVEGDYEEVTKIRGLITPRTVVAKLDEWPRLGKYAREAMFPVLEERKIRSSEGEIYLPELLVVMATMNRPDRRARLDAPEARRFAIGTMFDAEDEEKQKAKSMGAGERSDAHRTTIDPIITVHDLKAIQNTVRSNRDQNGKELVKYPESQRELAYECQKLIQGVVESFRPDSESTTGMSAQMARLARASAMAGQEETIQPNNVLKAAQRMVASRIIMLGDNEDIQGLMHEKQKELRQLV